VLSSVFVEHYLTYHCYAIVSTMVLFALQIFFALDFSSEDLYSGGEYIKFLIDLINFQYLNVQYLNFGHWDSGII
jgi:hypothetical protein